MRLFIIARHAESTLNLERRVNGDPTVEVGLTATGREQARRLGELVAHLELDLCVHTRFPRTRETAAIAAPSVPTAVEPHLDDVKIGDLEGCGIDEYRARKRELGRTSPFPGGETRCTAARRYCDAFRSLLAGPHDRVLVVCHEIPLRYALNGAAGSDDLERPARDLPNATPYLLDEAALRRAVETIERVT